MNKSQEMSTNVYNFEESNKYVQTFKNFSPKSSILKLGKFSCLKKWKSLELVDDTDLGLPITAGIYLLSLGKLKGHGYSYLC